MTRQCVACVACVACVTAAAVAGCGSPATPRPPTPDSDGGPSISVLTYNVNFEQFDLSTVDAIAEADADLVFLQETTPEWEAALRTRFASSYPTITFRAHPPDGGMGVLARDGVHTVAELASPLGGFPAWCVRVETALGPLQVLHAHLHPPLDEHGLFTGYFTTGAARDEEIQAFLGCFGDTPDLVLGDLNEGEGAAVDRIVAQGLHDAAAAFPPPIRTWSWDTPLVELEGRPDHVFHGGHLAARRVDVFEAGGSDHRPLRVELTRAR